MSSQPVLIRPALGEAARLGALYDARIDSFLILSAFQTQPPSSAVTETDMHNSEIKYIHNNSFKDKFGNLRIDSQLGASILAGLFQVEGSGRYLSEKRNSNLVCERSLLYNITTVCERLELQTPEVEHALSWPALEKGDGTHIVSEITWGSRNIITAKQTLSQNEDMTVVSGKLESLLKFWEKFKLSGDGSVETVGGHHNFDQSLEVTVVSDILANDVIVLKDLESAFRVLSNVPTYIANANGGKGKSLIYKLTPISKLADVFNRKISVPIAIDNLETECFEKFVQVFDDIANTRQELNDYRTLLQQNRDFVSQDHVRDVGDRISEVRHLETNLQANYARALKDVRTQKADKTSLWKLLEEFQPRNSRIHRLADITSSVYKEKIRFLNGLVARGAKYVGFNNESLDLELGSNPDIDIHVVYFSEGAKLYSELWKQNLTILYQLLNDTTRTEYVILYDHDAVKEKLGAPKIALVRNAEVLVPDVVEQRKLSSRKSLVRYNETLLDGGHPKPVTRVLMRIPCPNIDCGPSISRDWVCTRCGALVEYGHIDDYLYCDCGRCEYSQWSFRCSHPKHGLRFQGHDDEKLLRLLKSLEPFEELNILILGKTGVGKSTWINAFVNYLTHPSLDDALEADKFSWIIPFAFSTYSPQANGEFKKMKVSFGFDEESTDKSVAQHVSVEEKDGTTGESATQTATVHRVLIGDSLVRLVDTPGIGDTRGASQDKKNMADILSVLRTYSKLHGILILLKPNEQKLDVMFRFCIQELLTHLHRDAATNIAFGFTNTRGTSYTPGDTFDPLQEQLNKFQHVDIGLRTRNVYCFDSESFRYLAAQKQYNTSLGHLEETRKSWEHSVMESKRLLNHFKSLQPHHVTSTVNLYETRHRIKQMSEPMAVIAERIKDSIAANADELKELTKNELKKKDLEARLKIRISTLSTVAVEKPHTACAHADCVEYSNTKLLGSDGKPILGTIYKTLCHSPCYLNNIKVDEIGNAGLRSCWAMNGADTCRSCNHSWNIHLHIRHEYKSGTTEVDDPIVLEALAKNVSFSDQKQAAIVSKEKAIRELEFELKMIRDAAAQFTIFLERNAIMPINDATLDYLDMQLKQERGKIAEGGSSDLFERLSDFRKQYEQEVKTLMEYKKKGENHKLLDRAGVEALVHQLYSLPHYGGMLWQARQVLDSETTVITYREKPHVMRAKRHFTKQKATKKEKVWGKAEVDEVADKWKETAHGNSWIDWALRKVRIKQ